MVWTLTRIGLHDLFVQIGLLYQVLHFDFKPGKKNLLTESGMYPKLKEIFWQVFWQEAELILPISTRFTSSDMQLHQAFHFK
jgi:hypothetical protein